MKNDPTGHFRFLSHDMLATSPSLYSKKRLIQTLPYIKVRQPVSLHSENQLLYIK